MAKKLNPKASTEAFLNQGDKQAIRFESVPACAPLASAIIEATAYLRAKHEKRLACDRAMIPHRIRSSFADRNWDTVVRATAALAEAKTGGKKSPDYLEMFPSGTGPLVIPTGAPQVKVAKNFIVHLESCTTPGARTVCEEQLPKLRAAHEGLAAAIAERATAETALYVARAEELAAKRDFNRTIDKTIAEVRALYPEDRAMQDLVFPSVRSSRRDADDTLEDLDDTAEDEPGEQDPG